MLIKRRLLCFTVFPRYLQLSGKEDRHEQPLRGRCAENASPETATGPTQAGWRVGTGVTSRCPPLPHLAAVGGSLRRPGRDQPCGPGGGAGGGSPLTRVFGAARCCPKPHGGAPRSPPARRSAPRPGQRLPEGAIASASLFLPAPMTGRGGGGGGGSVSSPLVSHIASSGRQRPGRCCHHLRELTLFPRPAPAPSPPGSLLPPPRTQATLVRGWLSQKGPTPFIPWDLITK